MAFRHDLIEVSGNKVELGNKDLIMSTNAPKIFVLDDDIERIDWFQKTFGDIDFAHSVAAAQFALENDIYDIIFLDHDLGGAFTSGPDGDGIDVAQWMVNERKQLQAKVIVHSLNPVGAKNIFNTLNQSHNVEICNLKKLMAAAK